MQFTTLVTVLAAAMTASASPALRARNDGGSGSSGGSCSTNEQPVCCDGVLGILACAVSVIGGTCNGNSYCCSTAAPVVSSGLMPLF